MVGHRGRRRDGEEIVAHGKLFTPRSYATFVFLQLQKFEIVSLLVLICVDKNPDVRNERKILCQCSRESKKTKNQARSCYLPSFEVNSRKSRGVFKGFTLEASLISQVFLDEQI